MIKLDKNGDLSKLTWVYLPLTNSNQYVMVDGDYDGEYLGQYKWRLMKNGYVTTFSKPLIRDENGEQHYVYLHRLVAQPPKGMWVTFLNGNKRDCRSRNLAWITPSESALNREAAYTPQKKMEMKLNGRGIRGRKNKTGFKGIQLHPTGAYYALVSIDGKHTYLGSYATAEDAAVVHDLAVIDRDSYEFAVTNFPKEHYKNLSVEQVNLMLDEMYRRKPPRKKWGTNRGL